MINITSPTLGMISDEERNQRYDLCKNCEEFTMMRTCKICNCIMPMKTYWGNTECPKGKWGKIKTELDDIERN